MALPFVGGLPEQEWDGFPLDLGLVVEDRPTEFSCMVPQYNNYAVHTL